MSTPENNDNAAAAGKYLFNHAAPEETSGYAGHANHADAGKCPFGHGASEEKKRFSVRRR